MIKGFMFCEGARRLTASTLVATNILTGTWWGNLFGTNKDTKNQDNGRGTYAPASEIYKNGEIEYVVLGKDQLVSVENFGVKNSSGTIFKSVDGVLVGDEIKNVSSIIDIFVGSDISKVLIGDKLYEVGDLILIDASTGKEYESITSVVLDNGKVISVNVSTDKDDTDKTDKDERDDDYAPLPDEEFYELVDEIYEKYKAEELTVSYTEAEEYVMTVNLHQLSKTNKELIDEIVGESTIDAIVMDTYGVLSQIMTMNNYRYCTQGLGWDSVLMASDAISDEKSKALVQAQEDRIGKAISYAYSDNDKFNELIKIELEKMILSPNEEFDYKAGVGFNVTQILFNFIRINFWNVLNVENQELIKNIVAYADDGIRPSDGESYVDHARSTAYDREIADLLNKCSTNANAKPKTKTLE